VSRIAAVFPGQGSQRLGMARDFHEKFAESRQVFAQVSEALGFDAAELCFGDEQRLGQTEFQQPAILTAECAMVAALRARYGFEAEWLAGHSLGEYTALVAAGVLEVAQAASLVRERGRLMQEAAGSAEGGMTAVMMPDLDVERLGTLVAGCDLDVANHNSPDQAVLSGRLSDLSRAVQQLKRDPSFARARALPLRVSAPFHSRIMRPAAERFRPLLEAASRSWHVERAERVISNLTGAFHHPERAALADALARQICSPVLWLDCMRTLAARAERIIEIGPGRPLGGLFKGIDRAIESVTDVAGADRVFAN
jgi:[acyl-carrier-protein] S-malonyltransferase/trans-AT polyketide synthase/acyltransferase/oxidoreductase domain-containing protein